MISNYALVGDEFRTRRWIDWYVGGAFALVASVVGAFVVLLIVAGTKYGPVDSSSVTLSGSHHSTPLSTSTTIMLHNVQTLGTHNSYRRQPKAVLHKEHRYSHEPILSQLRVGLRHFEIDLHVASFKKDTFRVLHLQLVDDKTTCRSVHECIAPAYAWSRAVGGQHSPLVFMFEFKSRFVESIRTYATRPSREAQISDLEKELLKAWPGGVVLPSSLAATWPYPITAANGKAIFLLRDFDGASPMKRSVLHLLPFVAIDELHAVNAQTTHFVTTGTIASEADAEKVKDLVERQVIVRMRVHEPRKNPANTTIVALIENAGVQLVVTDHPPLLDPSCCSQRHPAGIHTTFSDDHLERLNT